MSEAPDGRGELWVDTGVSEKPTAGDLWGETAENKESTDASKASPARGDNSSSASSMDSTHADDSGTVDTNDPETMELIKAFKNFDFNGDGHLSKEEFRTIFAGKLTEDEFERVMKQVDADGSGTISVKEYIEWTQSP